MKKTIFCSLGPLMSLKLFKGRDFYFIFWSSVVILVIFFCWVGESDCRTAVTARKKEGCWVISGMFDALSLEQLVSGLE